MSRAAAAAGLLVLPLLLAGCLEERAEPEGSRPPRGFQVPPTDAPRPILTAPVPGDGRLEAVLAATYPLGGPEPEPFDVPEGAAELRVAVRWNGTWQGEVRLLPPEAADAPACAAQACDLAVPDPAPGAWRVLLPPGEGAEVEVRAWVTLPPLPVSPEPIPTPGPTPSPSPQPTETPRGEPEPQHALRRDVAFDGRLNQSDFVTVLPSHRLMRVWLAIEVQEAGDFAPQITLGEPTPQGFHDFSRACADECFIDVEDPAPGSWWILMGGDGRGLAVANVTLFEDRAARPDAAVTAYRSQHAYYSHAVRGEFEEAFSLPPGFARLSAEVRALGDASDPEATPRVQLVRPDGSVAADCDLASTPSCATVVQAPDAGAWQVRWLGQDRARAAEAVVTAEPTA